MKSRCSSSGKIDLGVGVEDEAGGVLEVDLADQDRGYKRERSHLAAKPSSKL